MAELRKIPVANSFDVVVSELVKASDSLAVTDAGLSVSVTDVDGTQVASASLTHSSGGTYRGAITPESALTDGAFYKVTITSETYTLNWSQWFEATARKFEI